MEPSNKNYAEYTRRGRKYIKRFYTNKEWNKLESARNKVASQIDSTKNAIEELFTKLRRLRKHQKFLNERDRVMSAYTTTVLEVLDTEDPLSTKDLTKLDRLANADGTCMVAAISEGPTLT